jgi:hypothetical protein
MAEDRMDAQAMPRRAKPADGGVFVRPDCAKRPSDFGTPPQHALASPVEIIMRRT